MVTNPSTITNSTSIADIIWHRIIIISLVFHMELKNRHIQTQGRQTVKGQVFCLLEQLILSKLLNRTMNQISVTNSNTDVSTDIHMHKHAHLYMYE